MNAPISLELSSRHRSFCEARRQLVAVLALSSTSALAYPGQQLLEWSASNLIAPIGLLAIIIAIVASIFRPEMIRGAAYTAIICAVLFFIIKNASTLMSAMQ